VNKAITFLDATYDIILVDPPYSDPAADNLLANLAGSKLVGRNSMVVLSHANRFPLHSDYDGLHLVKQRRYGDTYISIYEKEV